MIEKDGIFQLKIMPEIGRRRRQRRSAFSNTEPAPATNLEADNVDVDNVEQLTSNEVLKFASEESKGQRSRSQKSSMPSRSKKREGKFRSRNNATSTGSGSSEGGHSDTHDENLQSPDIADMDLDPDDEGSKVKQTSSQMLMGENDTSLLLEHGIGNRNILQISSFQAPSQMTDLEMNAYARMIYVPSTEPVSVDHKLSEFKTARYPEDEGLFQGKSIRISTKNQNRLEQRILKEGRMAWFGQDGEIESFPDPRRDYGIRIYHDELEDEEFRKRLNFVPATMDPYQMFQLDSTLTYELIVDIASITFTHHPLFSKEHILASDLESRFSEYSNRQESGITERAKNKLKALREVTNFTNSIQNAFKNKPGDFSPEDQTQFAQNQVRLVKYRDEMKRTRLERDQSLWDDKGALISVLDAWKGLKALRQHQEYSNTTVKLNILKFNEDLAIDRQNWSTELNQEYEDLKEEFEAEYETNYRMYQGQLRKWNRKNGPGRPSKVNERGDAEQGSGTSTGDSESSAEGEDDGEKSKKPTPPAKFESKKVKEEISKRFRTLNRLPGEPNIMLELTKAPITPTAELPTGSEKEVTRRAIVESCKLKIRILFNGKEVYRSKIRDLSPDFTAFFGLTVPISINEWPKSASLQIWDYSEIGKNYRGDVKLNFPNSKTSIGNCQPGKIPFKSDQVITMINNSGVGSGVGFELMGFDREGIPTGGFGTIRIGWSTDEHGKLLCPNIADHDLESSVGPGSPVTGVGESAFDPNDPNNARWLKSSVSQNEPDFSGPPSHRKKSSHTEGLDDQNSEFCTMEMLESSQRLHLLQLRDEDVLEFKNYRMVPAFEEDIPINIFKNYDNHRENTKPSILGTQNFEESNTVGLGLVADFSNRLDKIRQIRQNVFKLFENSSKQLTFEDLVIEEQIPDIGTLGLNLMSLFQPRRALRPERKERKKLQIGTSLIDTNINLVVNIVRATNLPMKRIDSSTSPQTLTTEAITGVTLFKKDSALDLTSPVKPFVEVSFERSNSRTNTSVGVNPIWNQELILGLSSQSCSQLDRVDDDIYVLIYDEVEVDILEDDRRRGTDIHQRFEKRWLGSVTIPFSTLYVNGRIEGTFKINSPSILLGYESNTGVGGSNRTAGFGSTRGQKAGQEGPMGTPNPNHSFITFFITLQPAITPAPASKAIGATGESPEVINHIKDWESKILQKYPSRQLKALVMNATGETLLATRYLEKINPPESLISDEQRSLIETMEDLAHYVSLFPTLRSTIEIRDLTLWLTSDVFVSTPGGGLDDHAILLASYFMYLEIPTWLVYGNAILDGPTTYVLTSCKNMKKDDDKEKLKSLKNETLIWNPCTGEYYNVNGTFCPFQNIWCIIGKSNIWGNISEHEKPQHLEWDFEKSNQWIPLFSKSIPEAKLPSLQPSELLTYDGVDKSQVVRLAQHIERNLKEAFMIWRKTSKTSWNRHCSAILKRILPKLEQRKVGGLGPMEVANTAETNTNTNPMFPADLNDDHLLELRDIMSSYQMTGFPLQLPYINMEAIIEAVFATSLHSIDTPNVEFALAVYVQGYSAAVFSVWIYLAALHRQK